MNIFCVILNWNIFSYSKATYKIKLRVNYHAIFSIQDMRNFFGYRLKFGHNPVRRKPTSILIPISQSKIFRTPRHHPLEVKGSLIQDDLTLLRFENDFEDMVNKQENSRVIYSADMYPAFSDINRDQFIKSPKQKDVDKPVIFKSILRDDPIRQPNRNAQYGHGSQRVINEIAMLDFLNRCSNDLRCIHFLR